MKENNRFNTISPGANIGLSIFLGFIGLLCLAPMILVVIISFSSVESLSNHGYTFFPSSFTLEAYKYVLKTGTQIWRGYRVTIAYSFLNTFLSLIVMSMFAYCIAQKTFKLRTVFTTMAFFTMLFSGGLVPSYILNVKYLHLYDNFWVYVIPGLFSFYNCVILRTFINTTIPDSLFEAARIDGAGPFRIYVQIVLPLFKAGLATIGLFKLVGNWNDWFTAKLYIENVNLIPIQTMLTRIMDNITFLKNNTANMNDATIRRMLEEMPTESSRMAITIISVAPILFAYPFFQRYFVSGLTIGSVKG